MNHWELYEFSPRRHTKGHEENKSSVGNLTGGFEILFMSEEKELIFRDEVFAIIGAAIEVHKELGHGFLEAVYHAALKLELTCRNIPFDSEKTLPVYYKGQKLEVDYKADLVCYGQVVVELKALDRLSSKEEGQLLNYLNATGLRVGILINFGSRGRLEWKRLVN